MTIESDGESEFCLPFNQTEELESTICTYVRPRPLSGKKNKVFGTILSLKTEYNFIEAGKASFFSDLISIPIIRICNHITWFINFF